MTVIAWDGKTLAADRRMTAGGLIRTVTKIRRIGGLRVGCAGPMDTAEEMFWWIARGRNPDEFPARQRSKDDWCSCVMVDPGGAIYLFECSPFPVIVEDNKFACGSGRDFALAAMYCGRTAAEAVQVASHFQSDCGGGVDTLD